MVHLPRASTLALAALSGSALGRALVAEEPSRALDGSEAPLVGHLVEAEVPAGGSPRIIRSEPSRLQEGGLVAVQGNASNAPLIADETTPGVNAYCGTPDVVSTCGFPHSTPTCYTGKDTGKRICVTGVCVCSADTCRNPVCRSSMSSYGSCESRGLARCTTATGQQGCITTPGIGWQCWHPCNFIHTISEYGPDNTLLVDYIRSTAACDVFKAPPGAAPGAGLHGGPAGGTVSSGYPTSAGIPAASPVGSPVGYSALEPRMDGGIKLTFPSMPIVGSTITGGDGESTVAVAGNGVSANGSPAPAPVVKACASSLKALGPVVLSMAMVALVAVDGF